MVVYSTTPSQCLAAIVDITEVVRASKSALWRVATSDGGGITKRSLMDYFQGKDIGVALRLGKRIVLPEGIAAKNVLGPTFRAPQSFRYLADEEKSALRKLLRKLK